MDDEFYALLTSVTLLERVLAAKTVVFVSALGLLIKGIKTGLHLTGLLILLTLVF